MLRKERVIGFRFSQSSKSFAGIFNCKKNLSKVAMRGGDIMKKSMLLIIMVVVGVMIMALPAGAAYFSIQTHGGWTTSTAGCADCHTTHAAAAAFLLSAGPTQTDACYACHGPGALASPYDVVNGAMSTDYIYTDTPRTTWGSNIFGSYAGGFNKGFDFQNATDGAVGHPDVAQTDLATNFVASTSAHNVEEPAGTYSAKDIPGATWHDEAVHIPGGSVPTSTTDGQFKCGSCHDPHGGALSNAKGRLLKKTLPAAAGLTVDFDVADAVNTSTYRIDHYPETINAWCAGCHDYFDAADAAGHTALDGHYRHPMGITVTQDGADVSIAKGTPLADGTDHGALTCFSCHRAHGTQATVSGAAASFNRYNADAGATATGSALLRLKERDTCYNCHGAATLNTWTYYHNGGGGAH
jgi:predicted CXXCH cytochrome family protein